jgi:hypothetical protein
VGQGDAVAVEQLVPAAVGNLILEGSRSRLGLGHRHPEVYLV